MNKTIVALAILITGSSIHDVRAADVNTCFRGTVGGSSIYLRLTRQQGEHINKWADVYGEWNSVPVAGAFLRVTDNMGPNIWSLSSNTISSSCAIAIQENALAVQPPPLNQISIRCVKSNGAITQKFSRNINEFKCPE